MKARPGLNTAQKLLNQEFWISTKSLNRAALCIAKLKSIWWLQHKGAIHNMSTAMSQCSKTHFTNTCRCCRMREKNTTKWLLLRKSQTRLEPHCHTHIIVNVASALTRVLELDLLFNRSKGHGSGCTTALSGMHRYLYRVHCLTPPASLCSDNTQNLLSSINGGTDTKTVPASKAKGNCAGNTPDTLILANSPRRKGY